MLWAWLWLLEDQLVRPKAQEVGCADGSAVGDSEGVTVLNAVMQLVSLSETCWELEKATQLVTQLVPPSAKLKATQLVLRLATRSVTLKAQPWAPPWAASWALSQSALLLVCVCVCVCVCVYV
jgi:hypothetical protein